MLILLPPSETKRQGGSRSALRVDSLSFPTLSPQREAVTDALASLSADPEKATRVLTLSARQQDEIAVNAALRSSPTMAAVDRYTGVLYDALDAASLDAAARRWLGHNVAIHSAPFGPVGALDRIPAYRLAAGTSLPGLPALTRVWADAVSRAIGERGGFVLDLRSEAYVALGPVPASVRAAYVRVVTRTEDGATRALNHFNKHAKGAFVRALALSRPRIGSADAVLRWAEASGIDLRMGAEGELALFV